MLRRFAIAALLVLFGAVEAARQWKFRPFIVSGHPVKAVGELLFHFQDLNEDAWQQVLRSSPPSGQ